MKKILLVIILFIFCYAAKGQNITKFEYFIDTDPGVGLATSANPVASPAVTDFDIPVSVTSLTSGFHTLYLRGQNTAGIWTHTNFRTFYILPMATPSTNITQMEYFVDTDPGIGSATQVSGLSPSMLITNLPIDLSASSYTQGFHTLYVRTQTADGQWTQTHFRSFYIANVATAGNLVKFEYFFDTDPGFDNGTAAPVTPPVPSVINQDIFAVPSTLSVGLHTIYIRAKDSSGDWTQATTGSFMVTASFTPTITSFTPTSGLSGTTVTITGTNFAGATSVRFGGTPATSFTVTSSTSIDAVVGTGNTGTISVTTSGGTATSSGNFCITPTSPTSPINGSSCGVGSVTLSVSGGTNGQYVWYTAATGGTAITNEVNSSYTTPSLSATTSYYAAITDGTCESARTRVDAIVNTPPSQASISANGATTFCQGGTVTLSSPGFSSYLWSDGSTICPRVVSTSNSLSLQVTDANGCQSIPSNPITITVNPLPATPAVSSTQPIVNGVIVLCTESNETTTLSAPSGLLSYTWSGGQTTSSFTTSQNGNYAATVTDANGCTSLTSATVSISSTSCISITSETLTAQINGTLSISLISLITTLKTLDVSSIKVVKQPSSGAVASVDANGELTIDYKGVQFSGLESVTIQVCDVDGNCKTQEFSIDVIGDIKVYNAVSPNGDGKNEFFKIENIDVIANMQQNHVSIYNRWGDEVFSISDYNNHDRVFNGYSSSGSKLPAGTYFYKISLANERSTTGYLELRY